ELMDHDAHLAEIRVLNLEKILLTNDGGATLDSAASAIGGEALFAVFIGLIVDLCEVTILRKVGLSFVRAHNGDADVIADEARANIRAFRQHLRNDFVSDLNRSIAGIAGT